VTLVAKKGKTQKRSKFVVFGSALLIVLMLFIGFTASNVIVPLTTKQIITVGDTFVYDTVSTVGNHTDTFVATITIVSINNSSIGYISVTGGAVMDSGVREYEYIDNQLNSDIWPVIFNREFFSNYEKSYGLAMIGLVPIVVEQYTQTFGDTTYTFKVKLGTNVIVSVEIVSDGFSFERTLKDTSVGWIKLI